MYVVYAIYMQSHFTRCDAWRRRADLFDLRAVHLRPNVVVVYTVAGVGGRGGGQLCSHPASVS